MGVCLVFLANLEHNLTYTGANVNWAFSKHLEDMRIKMDSQ